jgi:D-arabinose 1-dehydrogenase-like Zn-dependent alcohol dehydrogenase
MADGRDFDAVIVGAGALGIAACDALSAVKLRIVALKRAPCSKDRFRTPLSAFMSAVSAAERIISALAPAS